MRPIVTPKWTKVNTCDRSCENCPLLELCGGPEAEVYSCPFLRCGLKAPALKFMQVCSICHFGPMTWDLSEKELSDLIAEISNVEEVETQSPELPDIVPIISPLDLENRVWELNNEIDTGAIIIPFADLLKERLMEVLFEHKIRPLLHYYGKALLSSIMPDELLVRDDIFNKFIEAFDKCGFDGVIAWDVPAYVNIPLYDSWVNILKGLQLTYRLAQQRIPVVGLAKGNNERQIKFSVETLTKMGIKTMALHASEYLTEIEEDGLARLILYTYFYHFNKYAENVLVIGALTPRTFEFVKSTFGKGPKLSIGGYSYFLDASRGRLYSNQGYVDANSNFVDCSCKGCIGMSPRTPVTDIRFRAKHNLQYLIDLNSGNTTSFGTYDLILEEKERILFVSDLHAWAGNELLDDFILFLFEIKPSYVVLLGDVFDFYGRPDLLMAERIFRSLRELRIPIIIIEGCSDSDRNQFLNMLNTLVLGGKVKMNIWAERRDEYDDSIILDLYRYLGSARKQARIKLANGDLFLAVHGNEIIRDTSKPLDAVVDTIEEARKKAEADYLIMGHLHKAFIDEDRKIACTGCWTFARTYENIRVTRDDVKTGIVLDGEGNLYLKRGR